MLGSLDQNSQPSLLVLQLTLPYLLRLRGWCRYCLCRWSTSRRHSNYLQQNIRRLHTRIQHSNLIMRKFRRTSVFPYDIMLSAANIIIWREDAYPSITLHSPERELTNKSIVDFHSKSHLSRLVFLGFCKKSRIFQVPTNYF